MSKNDVVKKVKRAKGGGRKPLGTRPKRQVSLRVNADLYEAMEAYAMKNNISKTKAFEIAMQILIVPSNN